MRPLYVELEDDDRALLDALVVQATIRCGRQVRIAEVVRNMIRSEARRVRK